MFALPSLVFAYVSLEEMSSNIHVTMTKWLARRRINILSSTPPFLLRAISCAFFEIQNSSSVKSCGMSVFAKHIRTIDTRSCF